MEKICEFCTVFRPVVYCKADAAQLCLSCDARVHSANALSGRHFRTLLCQSCGNRPAYVRCMNHEMFICRNCDRTLHGFLSQHEKRLLKTYMGCPSPKDFAVLWGFDMNLVDNFASGDRFVSSSTCSANKRVLDLKSQNQKRTNQRRAPQQDNDDILQQIIGLKRFHLTEQTHILSQLRGKEQARFPSIVTESTRSFEENYLDPGSVHFPDISNDLQPMDISHQGGLKTEQCSSPFSQLEHLATPATVGTLTNGDTTWEWKCPILESQLWAQNLQDLGFCEEFECFDDIPDVDLTFCNFEDLFGDDQGPLIGNADMLSAPENTSHDISDDYEKSHVAESPEFFSKQLSLSKLSTETSFFDTHEYVGVSTILTTRGETSYSGIPDSDGTLTCSSKFKDKKKTVVREKEKQTRYSPQTADLKKRGKDHFAKLDNHQPGSISSSESY